MVHSSSIFFPQFILTNHPFQNFPVYAGLETEEDFDKHFPVEVTTRDFVYNWSLRDERSKINDVRGEKRNAAEIHLLILWIFEFEIVYMLTRFCNEITDWLVTQLQFSLDYKM